MRLQVTNVVAATAALAFLVAVALLPQTIYARFCGKAAGTYTVFPFAPFHKVFHTLPGSVI